MLLGGHTFQNVFKQFFNTLIDGAVTISIGKAFQSQITCWEKEYFLRLTLQG